jgi:nitrilase
VTPKPFLAAAVQAAPVFLDRAATVEKACALIADAASRGAKLIVLPETFVPAYPAWVWFLPLTRRAEVMQLYRELVENAVDVPGPDVDRLGVAARDAGAWVAIGVNERNAGRSGTTLYNTLLLFDDSGRLIERHRKLMPTGGERLVWTPGEPVPLKVHDTPHGRLGQLICWENYMPLARYALYEQGAQIHLAPTWDKSDQWLASMRHIAREGRVFVIGVCQALRRDQVPDRYAFKDTFPAGLEWVNVGNSLIVDPDGVVLAGPCEGREEILFAEIDPGKASGSRWIFDAAGHYDRPDLFMFAQRGAPAVNNEAAPRGALSPAANGAGEERRPTRAERASRRRPREKVATKKRRR